MYLSIYCYKAKTKVNRNQRNPPVNQSRAISKANMTAIQDHECFWPNIAVLLITGALVNGPYAHISSAVCAELGTHKSLRYT